LVFVVDLFDEVEEQLRSERYKSMARKAAPWGIGVVVLALVVTLGVWGWDTYRTREADRASDAYNAAVALRDGSDMTKAKAAFTELSTSGPKAYRAMALMQLGGFAMEDDDSKAAVTLFDQAAEVGADPMITDAARLKSAFALMDTAPYADIERRLTEIADDDRPYRAVAREALAFAKLKNGDMTGARSDFNALTLALDSTEALRDRSNRMVQLIDSGTAKVLPQAANAAIALPAPQAPPQLIPEADQ
jgi:hypothetical protein